MSSAAVVNGALRVKRVYILTGIGRFHLNFWNLFLLGLVSLCQIQLHLLKPFIEKNIIKKVPLKLNAFYVKRNGLVQKMYIDIHTSTCELSFARNWKLPFFNQRKGDLMISLLKGMLQDPVGIGLTSWSPVGRSSDWATEAGLMYVLAVLICHIFFDLLTPPSIYIVV